MWNNSASCGPGRGFTGAESGSGLRPWNSAIKCSAWRWSGRPTAAGGSAELRRCGLPVNRKRVQRVMREDNLLGLRQRKFVATTDSAHAMRARSHDRAPAHRRG